MKIRYKINSEGKIQQILPSLREVFERLCDYAIKLENNSPSLNDDKIPALDK